MTEHPPRPEGHAVASAEPVENAPEIIEFELDAATDGPDTDGPDAETASKDELVAWARSLIAQQRFEAANTWSEQLVARFPTDPEALELWADAAMLTHAWDAAVVRWAAVRAVAGRNPRGYLDGARASDELGRADEAAAVLAIGRKRAPDDIDVAFAWADRPARHENRGEAARRWAELRLDFPDRREIILPLFRALIANGEREAAGRLLEQAAAQFPEEALFRRDAEDSAHQPIA